MAIYGPTRLVLVNAGKFDYAEIDLTRPVHLVGPNNVGKTTLVNLLQFLYIDRMNHMSFPGYSLSETRRYYFPDSCSYVLFECRTPNAMQVLGLHGTGPGGSSPVQRFAYEGAFEKTDFVVSSEDGEQVRDLEDVKQTLALKGFTSLKSKHLKAALTGVGASRGVDLGLIPVRSEDGYSKFRDLFKGLIRLQHLDQAALKDTLCNTYASDLEALEVDLESNYRAMFDDMRARRAEIEKIERIKHDIQQVLRDHEERDRLRTRLVQTHAVLETALQKQQTSVQARRDAVVEALQETEHTLKDIEKQRATLRQEQEALGRKIGKVDNEIERIEKRIDALSDFDPQSARERVATLEDERSAILADLQSVDAESPDTLQSELRRVSARLRRLKDRLAHQDTSLGTFLSRHLEADTLHRLFRVLRPALLDLNREGPHLKVSDAEALLEHLRARAHRLQDDVWDLDGARIHLEGLPEPTLENYTNPDRIRARIANAERRRKRLDRRLQVAKNVSAQKKRAADLQDEIDTLRETLRQFEKMRASKERLPEYRRKKQALSAQYEEKAERARHLEAEKDKTAERKRSLEAEQNKLRRMQRTLQQEARTLSQPPDEWASAEDADPDAEHALPLEQSLEQSLEQAPDAADAVDALRNDIRTFHDNMEKEDHLSKRIDTTLTHIHSATYGEYRRNTRSDTLEALHEQLDGLAEHREAVEKMWKSILAGIGRVAKDLLSSLDTLKRRIADINRRLGQQSVSDLKRLRLEVHRNSDLVDLLEGRVQDESAPLFYDETANREDDLNRLDEMFRTHPRIQLTELFYVHFRVTTADGTTRTYSSLDSIQSNGTGITIKVLVHLVLINDLLRDTNHVLPFYLDEASSLDEHNLAGITEAAVDIGFVPILASPSASMAAEQLYHLRTQNGRVYLDHRHRVRLSEAPTHKTPSEAP